MQQQPPEQIGEDLYTSATADLSAGGVAMAHEAAEHQDRDDPPPAGTSTSTPISDPSPAQVYAREDLVSPTERPTFVTDYEALNETSGGGIDPTLAMAGGAVVAVGGGLAAAWAYARWQQERNRPLNRIRRQARGVVSGFSDRFEDAGDYLPAVDSMRERAPLGGGAAATLLGGLLLARMLHVGGWGQSSEVEESTETAGSALDQARRIGWSRWRDLDVRSMSMPAAAPRPVGFGLGGLIGVAAVAWLVVRVLRGGSGHSHNGTYYVETDGREEGPNQ